MRAIGLMSGTSMDGIDVALIDTDGEDALERGPAQSFPYDPRFRGNPAGGRRGCAIGLADRASSCREQYLRPDVEARADSSMTIASMRSGRASVSQGQTCACTSGSYRRHRFHGQTVLHRTGGETSASDVVEERRLLTVQIGDGRARRSRPASMWSTICALPMRRRRAGRAAGAGLSPRAGRPSCPSGPSPCSTSAASPTSPGSAPTARCWPSTPARAMP